jgi:UV DNA damage endonuclease
LILIFAFVSIFFQTRLEIYPLKRKIVIMADRFYTRLGLCCIFQQCPITFRTTTVSHLKKLRSAGKNDREYLSEIALHNCHNLLQAIEYCSSQGIGAFRIYSQFLPAYTHPDVGYSLEDLPRFAEIISTLISVKKLATKHDIRLTFHPDQFVVLSSPSYEVVAQSICELEYHGILADLVGADVINIHGGGAYGNKAAALERFAANFAKLSLSLRQKLTLENDDRVFSPSDLLPTCHQLGIPFVYDVHHHRCLPDSLSLEEATQLALETWNREPLFHLSSPKDGWKSSKPQLHHDFIDPADVPAFWKTIKPLTIDIEAKAKETAILKLQSILKSNGWDFYLPSRLRQRPSI